MSINAFIDKNGKTAYQIRMGIGKDISGKYVTKSVTVHGTALQAQKVQEQMQDAKNFAKACRAEGEIYLRYHGLMQNSCRVTLKKAYDAYLEKPKARTACDARINFKRNYWNDFVAWMGANNARATFIQDVSAKDAEGYINFIRKHGLFTDYSKSKTDVKLSPDTLNSIQAVCKAVFESLKREASLLSNPFDGIPSLRAEHAERSAFTTEQLKTIFDLADDFLKPMFFIGLFTGLSEGDVCTLKKEEIHFDRHHIYRKRNKTKAVSAIPMLPILEDFLRNLVADESNTTEFVLPEHAGEYTRDNTNVSKRIKRFLENKCGFETTAEIPGRTRKQSVLDFHSLRHTFCSMACASGIPMNIVQSIVGHMTPAMTELYSRHTQDEERMRWIGLLGERINALPTNGAVALPVATEVETVRDEKAELLAKIKDLPIDKIRELVALAN